MGRRMKPWIGRRGCSACAPRPPPKETEEGLTMKEEIELLNRAIVDGDDDVLASYGGSTAALRYCVELEELPEAKVGDGVKIDNYTTFRASRFAGLKNGNQGGAERGREKA